MRKKNTITDTITPLTVGDILSRLTMLPNGLTTAPRLTGVEPVVVAYNGDYYPPEGLISYRGYYDELCITPNLEEYANTVTVNDFVTQLSNMVGQTLTGWKGGEFVMNMNTPVWVDMSGSASNECVVDVKLVYGIVMIITEDLGY